jgi:hypothetical protein
LKVCSAAGEGKDLGRSVVNASGGPVDTRTTAILALIIAIIVVLIIVWV